MSSSTSELERPALRWERAAAAPIDFTIWPERPVTIGRDPSNTIIIDSPFVSKAHAIFKYGAGHYTLEDLGSANGSRLNGAAVTVATVAVGDVIQIGDERLVFIERVAEPIVVARAAAALGKNVKLAIAAGGTLVAVGGLLALFVFAAPAPATARKTDDQTSEKPIIDVNPDAASVLAVITRAKSSGVNPTDALLDEAEVQMRMGRPREAVDLIAGAVARDPKNIAARSRLQDGTAHLARVIEDELDRAERATSELRRDDATAAWERVLLLTDARDARHARAVAALASAH
jgi:hypothetical protein